MAVKDINTLHCITNATFKQSLFRELHIISQVCILFFVLKEYYLLGVL